jgi:hypothetical protein
VINGHVAAKYIYVRLFRGTDRMQKRTVASIGSWVAITLILWIIAWVIAEAIPVFNDLLSLIVSMEMPRYRPVKLTIACIDCSLCKLVYV